MDKDTKCLTNIYENFKHIEFDPNDENSNIDFDKIFGKQSIITQQKIALSNINALINGVKWHNYTSNIGGTTWAPFSALKGKTIKELYDIFKPIKKTPIELYNVMDNQKYNK